EDRVWAGSVDLLRSDDGGRSWGIASYWWPGLGASPSHLHADQHALVFDPRYDGVGNRVLFSLNDGGIWRTTNARGVTATGADAPCRGISGIRWTPRNAGYEVTQFYHGSVYANGASYLGGTQDNGTVRGSLGRGADGWEPILGGDGGYSVLDPSAPASIVATTQGGIVWTSSDGGQSFERSIEGITDPVDDDDDYRAVPSGFLFIAPLVGDPGQPSRLWLGGRRLWRSSDRGGLWQEGSAPTVGDKISAIAVSPQDPGLVLAGSDRGRIYRLAGATSSNGATPLEHTRLRRGFVSSIAFHPTDDTVAYATFASFRGGHLWKSVDSGRSWSPIDGASLPDLPVHSIVVDPNDTSRLYLGTDLGVLVSLDAGETWAVENTGFANVVTEWLTLAQAGGRNYLFAFTHGRGVWRVPLD
ncbi:MAG: hypothetical protein OEP45_10045, partial [Acidobacteriota bacterium]|nr:hypothetical protein [Acidobacteriota bacterium]